MSQTRWAVLLADAVFLLAFANTPLLFKIAGASAVLEMMFSGGLFWKWFVVVTHSAAMWAVLGSATWALIPPEMWRDLWHSPQKYRNER